MEELRELLNKSKNYSLTGEDVKQLLHGKCNILAYRDIRKYATLDALLGPNLCCVILYEWKEGYGHWVCVIRHDDLVEFFDPYGGLPDSQLDHVKPELRKALGEEYAYLSKLLVETPYEISYNEFPFQKLVKGTTTCGRWVTLRALTKELSLEDFKNLFLNLYGDDIATVLTGLKV